jgi:ComF family protein
MLDGGGIFPADLPDVNEKDGFMSTIARLDRARRGLQRAFACALLPPVCCLCGAAGRAPNLDLCDVCTTLLPVLGAGSPESPPAIGGNTLVRTLFHFKYAYPIDHFIRAVKFRGERVFARVLGELLAREHRSRGWDLPECIVPMPLHVSRLRERGFNQSLEIAQFAAASLGARVDAQSLVRRIATREQSGLSLEARRKNVRGAFEVVRPLPPGRIALLDDVVTTGSTATAAIEALRDAGAREVELWAIARVEKSGVDVLEQNADEN